jgi:hypothetical protein
MNKTKKNGIKNGIKNGSKIYTLDGKIIDSTLLYNGKPFFRKMTDNKNEIKLCKLIMQHPHKNIVTIYEIGPNYIDMEILNKAKESKMSKILPVMRSVKKYLQQLGVIYIDWKLDNIGISEKRFKLFDFDVSGLIDVNNKWIIEPPKYWSYNKAIQNGMKTPIEIDNYAFNYGLKSFS